MSLTSARQIVSMNRDGIVSAAVNIGTEAEPVFQVREVGHYRGLNIHELRQFASDKRATNYTVPLEGVNRAMKDDIIDAVAEMILASPEARFLPRLDIDIANTQSAMVRSAGDWLPIRELPEEWASRSTCPIRWLDDNEVTEQEGKEQAAAEQAERAAAQAEQEAEEDTGTDDTQPDNDPSEPPPADDNDEQPEPEEVPNQSPTLEDKIVETVADRFDEVVPDGWASGSGAGTVVLEGVTPITPRELELPALHHPLLPYIAATMMSGNYPYLYGPAGSGKSTLVIQAAEMIGSEWEAVSFGPTTTPTKLWGFTDANGVYHDTATYRAFAMGEGKVCLYDELDNASPGVFAEFNQLHSHGIGVFGDGKKYNAAAKYLAAGTGNTNAYGGDGTYDTRVGQDKPAMDRFIPIYVDYCEELEQQSAVHALRAKTGDKATDDHFALLERWISRVREVRQTVRDERWDAVISPRASIAGASMIAVGMSFEWLDASLIAGRFGEAHNDKLGASPVFKIPTS